MRKRENCTIIYHCKTFLLLTRKKEVEEFLLFTFILMDIH